MSAPKLITLDGAAAGEVGAVFRRGVGNWWDEVRDMGSLCCRLVCPPWCDRSSCRALQHRITLEPGGLEFLVGAVLPDPTTAPCTGAHMNSPWDCEACRSDLPARLAVVAPDKPPALLAQRVFRWGGEQWWCMHIGDRCTVFRRRSPVGEGNPASSDAKPDAQRWRLLATGDTWLEAVTAGIGGIQ